MLKSMTGFGVSLKETPDYTIKTEIKSLNSKYFELKLKLPVNFSDKETELRNYLESNLIRGKLDVNISFKYNGNQKSRKNLNKELMKEYLLEINEFCHEMHLPSLSQIEPVLSLPDVFIFDNMNNETDETEWIHLMESVAEAVGSYDLSRQAEGGKLEKEILNYLDSIGFLEKEIILNKDERIAKIREKVGNRLAELKITEINHDRFEQELIYYLEKLDITEETDRLTSHLDYFRKTLNENDNGRKLGFITQEMGREINTIGSKANDFQIQQKVVMMKNELEKIRQQLANIL